MSGNERNEMMFEEMIEMIEKLRERRLKICIAARSMCDDSDRWKWRMN